MEDVFMALGADTVTTTDTTDINDSNSKLNSGNSNKAVKLMHIVITAVASSARYVVNRVRTMVNNRRHRVHGTATSSVTVDDADTVEMIKLSTVTPTAATAATATNKLHEQLEQHDHSIDFNSPIHSANQDQYTTTTAAAVGLLHDGSHHSVMGNHGNGAAALPVISNGKHAEYTSNSNINKRPNSATMIRHLLYKRYTVFKRDKKGLFFQMILPGKVDTYITIYMFICRFYTTESVQYESTRLR
jgi:hypothetical protein